MAAADYSLMELMTVVAAREVEDGEVVFAGTGLPMLGVMLAQKTHAPGCVIIFEAGTVASRLAHLPMSVGDPRAMRGAAMAAGLNEVFSFVLQAGRVDVGFLSGAQVDRFGNINSTSIGRDPRRPAVRFSGSGGACDIACLAKRTIIIAKHERSAVPREGRLHHQPRLARGRPEPPGRRAVRGGPDVVVTTMGVIRFRDRHETAVSGQLPSGTDARGRGRRDGVRPGHRPGATRRRRPRPKNCASCGTSSTRSGSS